MRHRHTRIVSLLALLGALVLAVRPGEAQEQPAEGGRLAADLAARLDDPEPVLVWILFAEQPALAAAPAIRAAYTAAIEEARAPALAALARIDPLLPPRDERAALGVAGIMERERALLHPEELAALRESRDETVRLLGEMRREILSAAAPECARLQEPVAEHVVALPGGEVLGTSDVLNAVFVRMRCADLPALLDRFPGVARIERCSTLSVEMDKSVGAIGAGSFTGNGYNGSGQKVAIVDTGVDTTHPAFALSGGANVIVGSTVQLATASAQSNFGDNASSTDDLHSHGTHLAGTVASQDSTYGGVAPGTSLLNAKCFYRTTSGGGSGYDPDIAAATDWALTNGATVLNCSFGGGGTSNGNSALTKYYDAVVAVSGASTAIAAGNSGSSSGTILLPGDAFNIVTVGAFNDRNTTAPGDDVIAGFSSRGNTSDGRRKPDLSGPGVGIVSASWRWETAADFRSSQGTSMATPHVAGAMALLLDYNAAWQPEAVKALLLNSVRNTAPAPTSPDSVWGYGGMDLARAYTDRTLVKTGQLTSTGADAAFYTASSVSSGDRQTLVWNRSTVFTAGGRTTANGTAKTLVDMDLAIYDAADGSTESTSTSSGNSVEQVKAPNALTTGVVKVKRAGAFPTGQTSVSYAIASAVTLTAVSPPDLSLALDDAPEVAAGGAEVTVSVDLTNGGGLTGFVPRAVLTLPSGWSFASGSTAAVDLADAEPTSGGGAARTATWTVVTEDATGTGTLLVNASTDSYGETFAADQVQVEIDVDATDPTADAGDDQNLAATSAAGATASLDGTGSTDDSGVFLPAYDWDTDDDGDFEDAGGSATGVTPDVDFAIGVHTVTLRVTDHVGNTGTDTLFVTVFDEAPVAAAGADITIDEGSEASFDGTQSFDAVSSVTHEWLLHDGRMLTGATTSWVYPDDGVFAVTLRVTDLAGQTDEDSLSVTVLNVDPTVDAGADLMGVEGQTMQFAGTATDPGDDVLVATWSFDDGDTAVGLSGSHTYAQDGVYFVTLTVDDGDGGSVSDSLLVVLSNVPPELSLPASFDVDVADELRYTATATDVSPVDAGALTYSWRVLDGDDEIASGVGPSIAWTPERAFDGTLEVTVRDNRDATVRTAPLAAQTPPLDSMLPGALDDGLDPRFEKKVVSELLAAFSDLETGKNKRRRKAGKRLAKVSRLLTEAGVADGPLWWRLDALVAALDAGEELPEPGDFVAPEELGEPGDLLAALPSAIGHPGGRKRLGKALLALRFARRSGGSAKKLARLTKKARKLADRLDAGATKTWFTASLDAL